MRRNFVESNDESYQWDSPEVVVWKRYVRSALYITFYQQKFGRNAMFE